MEAEKALERVKKLLALAKDNPNEHEAETAMLHAQEILAKYGMTLKDIEGEQQELKKVIEISVTEPSGRIPWWKKQLAMVIADNFKCKTFMGGFRYNSSIIFFGLELDVEIAKEVYQYAELIVDKLAKSYVGKTYRQGKSTKGVRNEFIWGFITGLRDKFQEQINKNNWGLVLVTDALVEKQYNEKKLRKSSNSGIQPEFSGDRDARAKGYQEGQNFGETSSKKGIEE